MVPTNNSESTNEMCLRSRINHDVSDLFVLYFLKPENDEDQRKVLYNILDSLEWFKGKWSASRYPFIKDGKVVKEYMIEIVD